MKDGFLRVAVATPEIRVADPSHNAGQIIRLAGEMPPDTALAVFPELCVTGYTCGDLFLQPLLLREAEQALSLIHICTRSGSLEGSWVYWPATDSYCGSASRAALEAM